MAKRKTRRKSRKKQKSTADFGVIITIIFSILLTVLIYSESGYIGMVLSDFFGGIFGLIKYVLPIGSFAVAIKMACKDDDGYLSSRIFQYTLLLIFISVILSVYEIYSGEIVIEQNLANILEDAYQLGENNIGGGALGTLVAVPLFKLFGRIGTIILSIGASIVLFAVTFGIDISGVVTSWIQSGVERRKERHEERMLEREEDEERQNERESKRERTIRENRKAYLEIEQDVKPETQQIKINLNGRAVEEGLFKQEEEKKEEKVKEVLQLEHALVVEDEHYEYPPIELLGKGAKKAIKGGTKALAEVANRLQKTLYSFGVQAKVENVSVGPAITRYELKPAEGVRVSKIANLADDIALNLAAETIRIEAPIPGKQAVGIEVPNKEKEMVSLREVIESEEFAGSKSKLSVGLGKDVAGKIAITDIAKMPP